MKILRSFLDGLHPHFSGEGKLVKFYPLYEAIDTFLFSPGQVTTGSTHVRDGIDLKRLQL